MPARPTVASAGTFSDHVYSTASGKDVTDMPGDCPSRVLSSVTPFGIVDAMAGSLLDSLMDTLTSLLVPPLCVACREPELGGAAVCADCREIGRASGRE